MEGDLHQKGHEAFFYALNDAEILELEEIIGTHGDGEASINEDISPALTQALLEWLDAPNKKPLKEMLLRLTNGTQRCAVIQNVFPEQNDYTDRRVACIMKAICLILGYEDFAIGKSDRFARSVVRHYDTTYQNVQSMDRTRELTILRNYAGGNRTLLHIFADEKLIEALDDETRRTLEQPLFYDVHNESERFSILGGPKQDILIRQATANQGPILGATDDATNALQTLKRLMPHHVSNDLETPFSETGEEPLMSLELQEGDMVFIVHARHAVQDLDPNCQYGKYTKREHMKLTNQGRKGETLITR